MEGGGGGTPPARQTFIFFRAAKFQLCFARKNFNFRGTTTGTTFSSTNTAGGGWYVFLFLFKFRKFLLRWCAARTAPCLTAYPDERSEEGCAAGVRQCGQCAERTARCKPSLRHNLFFLMCGTLCAPLHPPAHYPRTTRRYAPRGTRLSMVWYAPRTRHNLFFLMCGTLCTPLLPPAHYPCTTRRYAPRGTRLSMVWYASRTICPTLSQLPKLEYFYYLNPRSLPWREGAGGREAAVPLRPLAWREGGRGERGFFFKTHSARWGGA